VHSCLPRRDVHQSITFKFINTKFAETKNIRVPLS
jgi:hypothetical protein